MAVTARSGNSSTGVGSGGQAREARQKGRVLRLCPRSVWVAPCTAPPPEPREPLGRWVPTCLLPFVIPPLWIPETQCLPWDSPFSPGAWCTFAGPGVLTVIPGKDRMSEGASQTGHSELPVAPVPTATWAGWHLLWGRPH